MVRLYCFLRLNLKTSTFLARSLPGADIARQLGHTDHIARCNPKLFSAGLNNGMHGEASIGKPEHRKADGLEWFKP